MKRFQNTLFITAVFLTLVGTTSAQEQGTTSKNIQGNSEILRLEDTIRSSKEQPQVLSIVPWQLPTQKRIDPIRDWGGKDNRMERFSRQEFLRSLRLFNQQDEAQTEQDRLSPTSN